MPILESSYKEFALKRSLDQTKTQKPVLCDFELTFRCPLRCAHCYSDCYNNPGSVSNELSYPQVRKILDKLREENIIWLCFTGGDPLSHPDFGKIYKYAYTRGFLITIFTCGALMDEKIAGLFARYRPFCVEVTLNAITPRIYKTVTGSSALLREALNGISLLRKNNIPYKLKTMVTRQNVRDLPKLKKYADKRGKKLNLSYILYPSLNGDLSPCELRLSPSEIRSVWASVGQDIKYSWPYPVKSMVLEPGKSVCCKGGRSAVRIDPYGNIMMCLLQRVPSMSLLKNTFGECYDLLRRSRESMVRRHPDCLTCDFSESCYLCYAASRLETGDPAGKIDYFCKLTKLTMPRNEK